MQLSERRIVACKDERELLFVFVDTAIEPLSKTGRITLL
jgi:hypothetical protein